MDVVVLAGGMSKRMYPFQPKQLIRLAGKSIIERILDNWKGYNVIIVYRDDRIKEELNGYTFVKQLEEFPGTAGAIYSAKKYIKSNSFFVISSDHILDSRIYDLIKNSKPNSLIAKRVNNPEKYGVLEEEDGKVVDIVEKPTNPKSNLVNIGIYHFSKDIFTKIENINLSPRGEYEITDVLIGMNIISTDLFWIDVGYPWELLDAVRYILSIEPEKNLGKVTNSIIEGKVIIEEGAEIISSTIEGPVYIGKNVRIGPYSHIRGPAVIEDNCEIGIATTIKNSIIMQDTNAKHLNYIGDSIIGSRVNFGAGSVVANLRLDEQPIQPMNLRKFGAIIGNDVKIGVNASIMPGSIIPPETIIYPGQVYSTKHSR